MSSNYSFIGEKQDDVLLSKWMLKNRKEHFPPMYQVHTSEYWLLTNREKVSIQ